MNDTLIEQIQADDAALDIKITAQEIALYLSEKKVPPEHLEAIKRFIAFLRKNQRDKAISALLQHSRIPQKEPSTFENFDFSRVTGEHAAQIRNLPNLTALYSRQNIAFIGPPGVGKTHLSMAYGNACCQKGLKAYFIKATELNEKFTKARRTGTESSAISGLVRPSCLIIDEIGRSIFDMENTRLFFDMIDRRCSKEGPNCMIFTSNLTPDKWRDFFREEDSLLCALDRTFDAATVYLMKGESYRGRNLKTYSIEISDPTELLWSSFFVTLVAKKIVLINLCCRPCFIWGSITIITVWTNMIIINVCKFFYLLIECFLCCKLIQICAFILQGIEVTLHRCIVVRISCFAHALCHIYRFAEFGKCFGRIL